MIRYLLLLLVTTSALSATFNILPIEQQIKESDGLFEGNFLKKKPIILEDGSHATQMIFKMNKEVGLQSDFYGLDEVIIHYPISKSTGQDEAPALIPGEKALLFIRNIDNRYWGFNQSFGAFKIINYGKEIVLVNSVMPQHTQFGQVKWDYFEKAVKRIKGTSFKMVYSIEHQLQHEKDEASRTPASDEEAVREVASETPEPIQEDQRQVLTVFWLIMILGLTGGIFRLSNSK